MVTTRYLTPKEGMIAHIRKWFNRDKGFFPREIVGHSGILSFDETLTLVHLMDKGTDLDKAKLCAIVFIYDLPMLHNFPNYGEWLKSRTVNSNDQSIILIN